MRATIALLLVCACGVPQPPPDIRPGFDAKSSAFRGARMADGFYTQGHLTLELSTADDVCADWKASRFRSATETLLLDLASDAVGPGTYPADGGGAFLTTAMVGADCSRDPSYERATVEIETFDPVPGGRVRGKFTTESVSVIFDAAFCEVDRQVLHSEKSCED